MGIRGNALWLWAASAMVFSLLCGCASTKQTVRPERSAVVVRLPPIEAMNINLRPERREAAPKPPYSVADEYRDRWLTLFEVTVSPISAGNLPETEPGGKAR